MDVAIIGATGSCGRQVAAQLVERGVLPGGSRLHLVGHAGGAHETELWGLRADLRDAFADHAPAIDVGTDVSTTGAELVVMMAGATVTPDTTDRAALAEMNRRIFTESAEAVGAMTGDVTVIVQSNPVELALDLFARHVPRHRVLGAAAWSDSLRFRRELAADLGVTRPQVHAEMWGQHGDHLVPIWSRIDARAVSAERLADVIGRARDGRALTDMPDEIRSARTRALELITGGEVRKSYEFIQSRPPDIRAAVKPFFTHFTAGRTTELATAHAVVDVVGFVTSGTPTVLPAQVALAGEMLGLSGPLAVPVVTGPNRWVRVADDVVADDEAAALTAAADAVTAANR